MDSLVKEKRKMCNSERECKFTEVKAAEQSYDWSNSGMVMEQCVCGSEIEAHPVWDVC